MIENRMFYDLDNDPNFAEVVKYCDRCGARVDDLDDRYIVNDEYYCEDCFDYEFGFDDDVLCEFCGEEKATHILPLDGCLCEDCAKRRCRE